MIQDCTLREGNKMKEISRRSMYHEDDGAACGPVSITAIDGGRQVGRDV